MRRMIDWRCECGRVEADVLADEDEIALCPDCHVAMQQDWLPRMIKRNAQWLTPVILHVNNSPDCPSDVRVRYPMRGDAPLPRGYERVEIRSDHEMGQFERSNRVLHHDRWYDNNGKGFDDKFRDQRMTH